MDTVVATINAKVLQEFVPQVPEIVSFIEMHYKMNTETARKFLQTKVAGVLAALHAPLLAERRERQNRIDALDEEVSYVRGEVTKSGNAVNSLKVDLNRVTLERDRVELAAADLKTLDSGHRARLKALLTAFGSSTDTDTPWEDVNDKVTELLKQSKELEALKKQYAVLKKRLISKTVELATSVQSVDRVAAERFARMYAELADAREEFASYRTRAENKLADLERSEREKSEDVRRLEENIAASEKRTSSSDARNEEEKDRLARDLVDSRATVAQRTEELRVLELQMASESNSYSNMSVQFHAHIDELNRKVNDLSSQLSEAVRSNETAKARFDEYSAVKALYERVSASLESARAHFAAIDYNEPVTKILLDILDRVRAHDSDFSTLKVPTCKDAAVQTAKANLVDAQNQTAQQQPLRTFHLIANVDPTHGSLPPSAHVCRPEDSLHALLDDTDWSVDEIHAEPSSFLDTGLVESMLTEAAAAHDIADALAHEPGDILNSAMISVFEDVDMQSFEEDHSATPTQRVDQHSASDTVPMERTDGVEQSAIDTVPAVVSVGSEMVCVDAVDEAERRNGESGRPNTTRGNGPNSRKRASVDAEPDDHDPDYEPELKRKRKSPRPDQKRDVPTRNDTRKKISGSGGGRSKVRHGEGEKSKDGQPRRQQQTAYPFTDDQTKLVTDSQFHKLFNDLFETGSTGFTAKRIDAAAKTTDGAAVSRSDRVSVYKSLFKTTGPTEEEPNGTGRVPMLSLDNDLDFSECELTGERTDDGGADSICAIRILERSVSPDMLELDRLIDDW